MAIKQTLVMVKLVLFITMTWILSISSYGTDSEYTGKSPGKIKTLSPDELNALFSGDGSVYSKAAEVNNYPSPKLVLSLAKQLKLTKQQIKDTQALYDETQTKAIELGTTIVNQERELELSFFSGSVNPAYLKQLVEEISATRASLRYLHLKSYIDQIKLLNKDQIFLLDQLRAKSDNEILSEPHDH